MIRIATIVGARPQFVKAAVLSRAFAACPEMEEFLIHTGQHYDYGMSEVFFEEMEIPHPRYNLGINAQSKAGESHASLLGDMLIGIDAVLRQEKPDWVLVYGDTDSTLAGALAANKNGIPLVHVEAGLRSFNTAMPEENNRVLTDHLASLLFCPTEQAVRNLERENIGAWSRKVFRTGDVMLDAALYYGNRADSGRSGSSHREEGVLPLPLPERFVLCTMHRNENTGNMAVLKELLGALEEVSLSMPLLMPLHPGTRQRMISVGFDFEKTHIRFCEPVSYLRMLQLLRSCAFVMTDSGGLQKEACFFGKYCLTLREETEWVELVEKGFNTLVGHRKEMITGQALRLWKEHPPVFQTDLYGNGHTGEDIVRIIRENS